MNAEMTMKIGIFYATNTGFTEVIADKILKKLGPNRVAICQNIEDRPLDDLLGYDVLLLGIATWDAGDLPYDWAMSYDEMGKYDFTGTRVVMFGLGDQIGYPETFLDAMGIVYRKFLERGASGGVGFWPTEAYDYFGSHAVYEDKFCGLAIDEDNEPELTDERIDKWCAQIMTELGLIQVVAAQTA